VYPLRALRHSNWGETMTRERWGTFSVADHKRGRAFVADVLLYDRLIIPIPPNDVERKDWTKTGWVPERLDSCLAALGDRHVIPVPWTEDKRQVFRTRYQGAQAAIYDTDQLAYARRTRIVDPMFITRQLLTKELLPELPEGVTKVWAMAAYPSLNEFKQDFRFNIGSAKVRQRQLQSAIAHRFLVPITEQV